MRKTLLLALFGLYVAGCSLHDDGSGDSIEESEKRPRPPHPQPGPDASVWPSPDADTQPSDPEPPPVPCADTSEFDVVVFAGEIMPILNGTVDLDGGGNPGCSRSECHGRDRGAGTLFLDANGAPEENLARLACFVDWDDLPASQALLCPLGDSGCLNAPHPGADIFSGVEDLNYQRILTYLETEAAAAANR